MRKKTVKANKYGIDATMIHDDALQIIKKLQNNGFDGCIVGGGVRDLILHKTPKDFDVVTNATPEDVRKVFRRNSIIIGKRFKIVHIICNHLNYDKLINNRPINERHVIEVSTYRSNVVHKHAISKLGRIMVDNNYGTQKDDAFRRDFTVNALYYDPIKEVIIDYTDGITDITNNTLRMIGDVKARYIEDPVRILRAIRLSIKTGLNIEADTLHHIDTQKKLLLNENSGRLFEEMLKILLSGYSIECIQYFQQMKFPRGVFVLFDKLFLRDTMDEFALKVLKKTDDRIKETGNVSVAFILAGLLWNNVYDKWQTLLLEGGSPIGAMHEAIDAVRDYGRQIGINQNIYGMMSETWMMQLEFDYPIVNKIYNISNTSKTRQGLYLYNIRMECGGVDLKLNNWWNEFFQLLNNGDDAQKNIHIDILQKICNIDTKNTSKNKKRKKKINHTHKE